MGGQTAHPQNKVAAHGSNCGWRARAGKFVTEIKFEKVLAGPCLAGVNCALVMHRFYAQGACLTPPLSLVGMSLAADEWAEAAQGRS